MHGPRAQAVEPPPATAEAARPLVEANGLTLRRGGKTVLDGVGFALMPGETLALVGESGAGKSTIALALMGLVRPPEVALDGSMRFDGQEMSGLNERAWRAVRGRRIGMIFQDAGAALNPCFTVGHHLAFPLRRILGLGREPAKERAVELFEGAGLNDAAARLGAYPHELSGGMQQRVMIAIAIACNPSLLLADEPTSALDVTIQAQIIRLILDQTRAHGTGCIFVLHDLALASQACDRIVVLYAGQVMEAGTTASVLERPLHPYTRALRSCVIEIAASALDPPAGNTPSLDDMPRGCRFATRCERASDECRATKPPLAPLDGRLVACWHPG